MKVNILTDSRSWILRRMSEEILKHPDINGQISKTTDPSADVNMFVNYYLYSPVGTKTVAYFTHHDPRYMDRWHTAEKACDGGVYMADRYKPNMKLTCQIPPAGLDVAPTPFTIGIVGSQYSDGRKGEDRILEIARYLKEHSIKWSFFGGNWKILDALKAISDKFIVSKKEWKSDKQAIDYYKSLDTMLIASYLEGGPVPAMEAVKLGVKTIVLDDVGNNELWGNFWNIGIVDKIKDDNDITNTTNACLLIDSLIRRKEKTNFFIDTYTWKNFTLQHYSFFERILNG
jgi:hypothetical protein